MIGIGGHLAVPPLPHHLATATVEADLDRSCMSAVLADRRPADD